MAAHAEHALRVLCRGDLALFPFRCQGGCKETDPDGLRCFPKNTPRYSVKMDKEWKGLAGKRGECAIGVADYCWTCFHQLDPLGESPVAAARAAPAALQPAAASSAAGDGVSAADDDEVGFEMFEQDDEDANGTPGMWDQLGTRLQDLTAWGGSMLGQSPAAAGSDEEAGAGPAAASDLPLKKAAAVRLNELSFRPGLGLISVIFKA